MLVQAIRAAGPAPTRDNVLAPLQTQTAFTADGLLAPATRPPRTRGLLAVITVEGGAWHGSNRPQGSWIAEPALAGAGAAALRVVAVEGPAPVPRVRHERLGSPPCCWRPPPSIGPAPAPSSCGFTILGLAAGSIYAIAAAGLVSPTPPPASSTSPTGRWA